MAEAGHPEPLQALAMSTDAPAAYTSTATHIVPIDLGPSTEHEARTYGYAGSTFPIDAGGGTGIVVSRDPEFDDQADRCQRGVDQELPDLSRIQSEATALSNRVRTELVKHASAELSDGLVARFRCVRSHGYPGVDPRQALEQESAQLLAAAGVDAGREVDLHEPPTEADVAAGSVGVFPPDPARSYEPTPAEEEFALTYVRCGQQQHFGDTLRSAESTARKHVFQKYREPGRRLYRALVHLGVDLGSTSFSGGKS
jgi:hypothetical protein